MSLPHLWFAPDGHPVDALRADAYLADDASRQVALSVRYRAGERVVISTVYRAVDGRLALGSSGLPLIYETRLMGGAWQSLVCLYVSRDAALAGHRAILAELRAEKRERDERERVRARFRGTCALMGAAWRKEHSRFRRVKRA